jgi:MFS family permease
VGRRSALVRLSGKGFNLLVIHPSQVVSAVSTAVRNDQVRRVELAWSAAIAAEWAHFVALGVFAYQQGGTSAVGVAGLVRLLPAAALAPFAASLGDRFRRERFLAVIAVVGSGALAASAGGAFVGNRPLVFASAAFVGICTTLVRPALQALLPSLARTPEELVASNGATSIVEGFGTLAGPLVAGVLVSVADVGVVFVVAAGTFLIAAVLFVRVRVEGLIDLMAAVDDRRAWRVVGAGFQAIAHAPRPRLLVGLIATQCFVRGCLNVLIVVAVFRVLHGSAAEVGYLIAAMGIGGLIGALGAMTLERRLAFTLGLALVFWGVPIALIAARPYFAAALILLSIIGAANSVEDVAGFTLLQRTVPDEILTRVLGVVWGLGMGAVALGSIVAPAVVNAFGPRPAFIAVGAILPLLTLATYRGLLEIDRKVTPVPELALLSRVPMFAPLSIAMKERLAANLVPVSVSAGERVIRAGDPGDRFYIVGEGELEIDASDLVATAHTGDYFGEIALIRDVPRTATVTATVDSRLYALHREDFLAAVTGHHAAHAAGHEVAEARLEKIARARALNG